MFNYCGGKFVNLVNKLVGVDKLQGTASSCRTVACWEGSGAYYDVAEKNVDVQEFISEVNENGGLISSGELVQCTVIGGGDMAWISDINGHRGFAGKHKCCHCTANSKQMHASAPRAIR